MILRACLAICVMGVFCLPAGGQEEGQIYRIKNRFTDKVLVPNDDGTLLVQTTPKPKEEHNRWKLVKAKNENFFRIINVATGKAITSPSKEALAQVALEAPNSEEKSKGGQLWSFEKRGEMFTIQSRHSGFYLDVAMLEKADGATIIQQELNEKGSRGNQVWDLVPVKSP